MVDQVSTNVLHNGGRYYSVQLLGEGDGTGESTVRKVDLTDLNPGGTPPIAVSVLKITGSVGGTQPYYISLLWERDSGPVSGNYMLATLPVGSIVDHDYKDIGGMQDPGRNDGAGTGDILLTTDGATDGDTYSIRLDLKMTFA